MAKECFEVISLKVEALEWMRVKKSVQNIKRGPGAQEFGCDPTGNEEPIKCFKQGYEATSGTLGAKKSAQEV